tara:strand:+ start:370 stop:618 length:249 start_codon:yes stop_codon:yes gene_type:complete
MTDNKIDPEVDRQLYAIIQRFEAEDACKVIHMLGGEVTRIFMQGVQIGEAVARRKYLMDPKVKPVDFLYGEGQRQQPDDAGT